MRADRLLAILLHLQTHRRLTVRQLAARLEVSPRTVHRDMEALCLAGVPLHAQRGAGGGWLLPESYRTDLTGMTEAERRSLLLAQPPRLLADLGLRGAAEAALAKLIAALPAGSRGDAERMRARIHIDPSGWRRAEDAVPLLPVLQEALWRDRRLRLAYQKADGAAERTVDPLGLVAKGSLWYLIAAVGGQPRTYRVSRILAATPLDEPCERPPEFDLAAYWGQSAAGFVAALPRHALTVRVAPDALDRARSGFGYMRVEAIGATDGEGWTTLELVADAPEVACAFVLSFGGAMEVVEPAELRERVLTLAAGVLGRGCAAGASVAPPPSPPHAGA